MVLGYHELAPVPSRDVYTIQPTVFAEHIALVRATLPDSAGVITFDDAHASQVRHALPVLAQTSTLAHFFVPTAHVDARPSTATRAQVREMAAMGHHIGSHTHTHPLLTDCSAGALMQELGISRRILEDWIGQAVTTISLPGGRYNARVLDACAEAGYTRVYTSSPYPTLPERLRERRLVEVIGRLIVRRAMPMATLAGYLRGDRAATRRLRIEGRMKESAKAVIGDTLYQRLWSLSLRRQPREDAAAYREP